MTIISIDEDSMDLQSRVPWFIRLWAAVVRRAIVDWLLYKDHPDPKQKKSGVNAGNWIFGSTGDGSISTFESVCYMMGMSPEYIRSKIRSMTEEDARKLRGMEFGDEW